MRYPIVPAAAMMLLIVFPLAAQDLAAPDRLTGKTSRIWIVTAIDQSLGGGQKCTEGREFEFYKSGSVEERVCKDGTLVENKSSWVHENDGIDDYISIGDHKDRLIVSTQTDTQTGIEYEEAVLRREGEKTEITSDIVLQRVP